MALHAPLKLPGPRTPARPSLSDGRDDFLSMYDHPQPICRNPRLDLEFNESDYDIRCVTITFPGKFQYRPLASGREISAIRC